MANNINGDEIKSGEAADNGQEGQGKAQVSDDGQRDRSNSNNDYDDDSGGICDDESTSKGGGWTTTTRDYYTATSMPTGVHMKSPQTNNDNLRANPILPKMQIMDNRPPPGCPLKGIEFVKIDEFIHQEYMEPVKMSKGFDLVNGKQAGFTRRTKEERQKQAQANKKSAVVFDYNVVKMDEHTAIIRNIVYARDPKIFDTKTGHVNQRQAFTHDNFLDIKALI